ncbi:TonB family protein [Psychrosphaera sp. F3M07]|jgi:protein TonB|uniref:TonB family protein n=1 Tax=Psychrosphaera aquimarina TaxID=2044854 RepID=A0ABU3R3C8_9GAMM|nr:MULTISPECIES: TonB family protein [Psychrosphaera]MBU2917588.1 TonB family protein [Psychrosphaera sp. F3M07]MDU0114175.1 TonB family protein [Psychrosphaera aquimarina]
MGRFIASIILGVVVTFGLFVFMAFLISSGSSPDDKEMEKIVVEINTTPPEGKTQQRNRVPPPPPPPPKQPPKPAQPEPEQQIADNGGFNFNMPSVDVGTASAGLNGPGALIRDGDATPIVRIEPKFPSKAARDGIEGWVQLTFEINEIGGVENVDVINSEPKRVFDREAKKALRKWKYKPKMVDGKAQRQTGLTVQLDFKLGN